MTTKRTLTAAAVAAVLIAAVALPALARLPRPGAFGQPLLVERLAARLDLSDAQKAEIRGILRAHAPELAAEARRVADGRKALFATIHTHPPVEAEVRVAAAAVAAAEADLAVSRAQVADEVYGVLTPEQQAEADEIRADLVAFLEGIGERLRAALLDGLAA